jgi:hypothetical protein
MNNGANYTGAGALLAADDLTFDNTSVINAAATANLAVNSVTIAANYTGTWALTGFTATFGNGFSDDGTTGAHNYGNGITCNGASGTFHVGSGVVAITATSCVLTMNGTTGMTLDDDEGVVFKSLTLGAAAIVVSSGGATSYFRNAGVCMTLGNNTSITFNRAAEFGPTGSNTAFSIGTGCTINGTASLSIRPRTAASTTTIPAITYTGSGTISVSPDAANTIITLTGNFSSTGTVAVQHSSANTFEFNSGNFSITTAAFVVGANLAGCTATFNFGASVITCSSFTGATYNTGTTNLNLQTSQWACSGNWTFGSNHTVNPGTSSVTITGTSTLTSNGKSFFDLTINSVALTVTLADALTLAAGGDLTLTSGTLNLSTFNLTVGGNTAINGTSTLTATGSTCSFAGNYTTAAGCTVTINAATNYTFTAAAIVTTNGKALPQCTFNAAFTINDSCTIARIIRGVDGFTGTFEAGQTFTISNLAAANWSGAAAALNAVRSSVPGTQFTIVLPNAATLTFYDSQDCIYQGFDITANDGTSITRGNNVRYLTMNVITVLPITGTTAGGTLLTFTDTGNGMGGTMVVTVGGAGAGAETVVDTQHSTATTPAGAAGAVNIVITNGDGDTRTLVGAFTYVAPAAGGPVSRESRCWVSAAIGI